MGVLRRVLMFFFQAEDGIRDRTVTGVQTCALPISPPAPLPSVGGKRARPEGKGAGGAGSPGPEGGREATERGLNIHEFKIGRASCRERVRISVGVVPVKKKHDIRQAVLCKTPHVQR